jgi:hypothetical protein
MFQEAIFCIKKSAKAPFANGKILRQAESSHQKQQLNNNRGVNQSKKNFLADECDQLGTTHTF